MHRMVVLWVECAEIWWKGRCSNTVQLTYRLACSRCKNHNSPTGRGKNTNEHSNWSSRPLRSAYKRRSRLASKLGWGWQCNPGAILINWCQWHPTKNVNEKISLHPGLLSSVSYIQHDIFFPQILCIKLHGNYIDWHVHAGSMYTGEKLLKKYVASILARYPAASVRQRYPAWW